MALTILLPETTYTGFVMNQYYGAYAYSRNQPGYELVLGETYTVVWDDKLYTCTAQDMNAIQAGSIALGNLAAYGGNGNNEPFVIGWTPQGVIYFSFDANITHTVAIFRGIAEDDSGAGVVTYLINGASLRAIADVIREKTGKTAGIAVADMPAEIAGITGGGGSSADVRYVTFMSEDGAAEYGRIPVAVGYDCPNPKFATPTKESTAQYTYAFYGWATVPNGAADTNALKAVTENRTVYANFASAVRYYTITYYDGETVLKTESLAYGVMPNYIAEKDGFNFEGWEPALATVTGDASYYAQFSTALTFAGASWADIAEISAAGTAADTFSVGDEKTVPITYADGTTATIIVRIAGFNHDDLADGSGKAGISILCRTVPDYQTVLYDKTQSSVSTFYPGSKVAAALSENGDIWNMLPQELIAVIKPVAKKYDTTRETGVSPTLGTANVPLWVPSIDEIGISATGEAYNPGSQYVSKLGEKYELFPSLTRAGSAVTTPFQYFEPITAAGTYISANTWLRNVWRGGSYQAFYGSASKNGSLIQFNHGYINSYNTRTYGVWFGFCV